MRTRYLWSYWLGTCERRWRHVWVLWLGMKKWTVWFCTPSRLVLPVAFSDLTILCQFHVSVWARNLKTSALSPHWTFYFISFCLFNMSEWTSLSLITNGVVEEIAIFTNLCHLLLILSTAVLEHPLCSCLWAGSLVFYELTGCLLVFSKLPSVTDKWTALPLAVRFLLLITTCGCCCFYIIPQTVSALHQLFTIETQEMSTNRFHTINLDLTNDYLRRAVQKTSQYFTIFPWFQGLAYVCQSVCPLCQTA